VQPAFRSGKTRDGRAVGPFLQFVPAEDDEEKGDGEEDGGPDDVVLDFVITPSTEGQSRVL
jgi:hypothetical protein